MRYGSERYSTSIEVPAGYVAQPEPANGDGRTLISRDGKVQIFVYGAWDIDHKGLTAPSGLKITYSKKGPGWAVYSGVQDGKITYTRMVSACKDAGLIHNVVIEYPPEMQRRMAYQVARVAKSLTGGCPAWVSTPHT